MPSWYDIVGLSERESEECHGIDKSRETIIALIKREIEEFKIPANRVVVGGFSQGGAMSVWTGLQWASTEERLGAVICLSGYLPAARMFKLTEQGLATPVFHAHGARDPLIKLSVAEKSKHSIIEKGHNSDYMFKVYPHMAHSACQEEMIELVAFLKNIFTTGTAKSPKDMSVKELRAALRAAGIRDDAFLYKHEMIEALEKRDSGAEL